MPALAWKGGNSQIDCTDGAKGSVCATDSEGSPIKWNWDTDTTQVSDEGSSTVFANGIGVVRRGDKMASHAHGDPCVASATNHSPPLDTYSATVFANGLEIGRLTDHYDGDGTGQTHEITTGSPNVFANQSGVGSGVNQVSPVNAAAAATGASPSSLSTLSDEELTELQSEVLSDQGGSSGRNPGTNLTRNEYGETYNPPSSTTAVDPSYTVPDGSNPSAGLTGDVPPVAPRERAGSAGPDFNNYAPIQDDDLLTWSVYAAVGRQVDPAIVTIARAMATAVGTRLTVNSGYRSRAYNSSLRGAAGNSNHMYGVAMDVSMGNLPDDARRLMLRAAIENGAGGIGIYAEPHNNFIHIDLDRRRTWKPVPSWGTDLMRSAGYIS
jgi:hypothetical protein